MRLNHTKIDWYTFRDTFVHLGGDGIYAAWKLTYLEPVFENMSFLGREKYVPEKLKERIRLDYAQLLKSYKERYCLLRICIGHLRI